MCGGSEQTTCGLRQRILHGLPTKSTNTRSNGDLAAGPVRRHVTLADPGRLAKICCWVPGVILFSLMLVVLVAAFTSSTAFYAITAALTIFSLSYTTQLSFSCVYGAWKMRQTCSQDWDARLRAVEEETGAHIEHIVILPNYCENEQMLQETLENIGQSAVARDSIRVVLAMEAREGESGQRKAERLISNTKHLFAGMMAAYHPAGLPDEIAGKSSNTQWAYHAALQHWGMHLASLDPSQVVLTVGDADTLWHPQFFSGLSCEALSLTAVERAWTIWQPPVLLLRNLFSVPGPTRVSAYGTILFELAGLANQAFGTHFCYSAYSLSLALASHHLVNGWDTDVIAEDHHMFCKCYFASIRENIDHTVEKGQGTNMSMDVPTVRLRPVYLPAISYLVESGDGWLASVHARFQQARRHSQGIAELSYVLLQYAHILHQTSFYRLPVHAHAKIIGIASKMATVHIVNQVQSGALVVAIMMLIPEVVKWVFCGGLTATLEAASSVGYSSAMWSAAGGLGYLLKYMLAIFGPIPPMEILMTFTVTVVIADLLEGRLTQSFGKKSLKSPTVLAPISTERSISFGFWHRLRLFFYIQNDLSLMAHFTLLAYGLLPVSLAAWSLLRRGHKFEYIVAAKPT